MTADDGLSVQSVWDVLETYAQLYFIYTVESSIIISNLGIRTDGVLTDLGNFPLWNSELFRRKSGMMEELSGHSHILDFDMLRLGKKMIERNKKSNAFEFGVLIMTEVGKERGNMLETAEMKKSDEEANQKNDRFNEWMKMIRHSATVDNFPFVKVMMDEQRAMSLAPMHASLHISLRSKRPVICVLQCRSSNSERFFTQWSKGGLQNGMRISDTVVEITRLLVIS